jgi:hypothetical protein
MQVLGIGETQQLTYAERPNMTTLHSNGSCVRSETLYLTCSEDTLQGLSDLNVFYAGAFGCAT